MLQNIAVGPPMVGATDLKSSPDRTAEKGFKGSDSDSSFGKALEDRVSKSPKEMKESMPKEMRAKEEKPDSSEVRKTETVVVKPEGKITKKATVRQQAIQEFMDSFESEFEISPTRLVEAMAQLDENQLAQSPEVTADAVIDQLGLDDADADKARAMYAALLMQLNQMPQQQPQAKPVSEMTFGGAGMSQQNMQARIAAAQGKQNTLSASADRVTQKFWMNQEPKAVPTSMPSLQDSLAQRMMMDEGSFAEALPQEEIPMDAPEMEMSSEMIPQPQTPSAKLEELPPHLKGQMAETLSPALLAALAAKQAAGGKEGTQEEVPALMEEFQQAIQAPKLEKPVTALPGSNLQAQNKVNPEAFFQNQSQGQSLMQQNSQQFAQKGLTSEKEILGKLTEKATDFKSSLTGLEGVHGAPIKGEALKADAALPMAAPVPTAPANPGENDAAVKQLMNQAQYLIKKGGGEMKVQMTPEGMGTIHLKVMLQDGKVNLQMSADTQEAKKTIESSLAELKTSLAAHKLSMENVKVDVVNSTSTDTATQNQTNMNGQNQRDQARQFWNQFNENFGSQGRRESFTEMPNLKGYGAHRRDPLQPIETASKTRTRSVDGKGSGLNLVA